MTHGLVMNVPAPINFYDALHGEVARRSTAGVDGLLLHVGRATDDGFQVLEVWESKRSATASSLRSSDRRSPPCRAARRRRANR
jgi:hypothetical protein